jgi:hypothetical protein
VSPQDLFTANQIVQLQPIAGLDTYRRFVSANAFVQRIYPNFEARPLWPIASVPRWVPGARRAVEAVLEWTFAAEVLERLCRIVYRWHLGRRSSSWASADQVRLEAEGLKLHTTSHRHDVMRRFRAAMAEILAAGSAGTGRPVRSTGSRAAVEVPVRGAWHGQGGSDTAA